MPCLLLLFFFSFISHFISFLAVWFAYLIFFYVMMHHFYASFACHLHYFKFFMCSNILKSLSFPTFSLSLLCFPSLYSVVEEHAEKQAENQSATLGVQSTETIADPTATLLPSELDLTELGQTASIPPSTKSQQVHTRYLSD